MPAVPQELAEAALRFLQVLALFLGALLLSALTVVAVSRTRNRPPSRRLLYLSMTLYSLAALQGLPTGPPVKGAWPAGLVAALACLGLGALEASRSPARGESNLATPLLEALGEELLYRGVLAWGLFQSLSQILPEDLSQLTAAVAGAVVYGALHPAARAWEAPGAREALISFLEGLALAATLFWAGLAWAVAVHAACEYAKLARKGGNA